MSDLRIGLVAEGPTDYEIINSALLAILSDRDFFLTLLQPEPTGNALGNGWTGVVKWCHEATLRYSGPLETDPFLSQLDVLLIHIDADVAEKRYGDDSREIELIARNSGWLSLPCGYDCPPISAICDYLSECVRSWLGNRNIDHKGLLCIPAQSSGTWLAHAVLPIDHGLLVNSECNTSLESRLPYLPKAQRAKKTAVAYRAHGPTITRNWGTVKACCSQASRFERDFLAALPPPAAAAP